MEEGTVKGRLPLAFRELPQKEGLPALLLWAYPDDRGQWEPQPHTGIQFTSSTWSGLSQGHFQEDHHAGSKPQPFQILSKESGDSS